MYQSQRYMTCERYLHLHSQRQVYIRHTNISLITLRLHANASVVHGSTNCTQLDIERIRNYLHISSEMTYIQKLKISLHTQIIPIRIFPLISIFIVLVSYKLLQTFEYKYFPFPCKIISSWTECANISYPPYFINISMFF